MINKPKYKLLQTSTYTKIKVNKNNASICWSKYLWFLYSLISKAWPDDALEMVANKFLQDIQMEENIREASVHMCKSFHESVRKQSERLGIFFHDSNGNIWVG